jgi:hypothetical protein
LTKKQKKKEGRREESWGISLAHDILPYSGQGLLSLHASRTIGVGTPEQKKPIFASSSMMCATTEGTTTEKFGPDKK